MSASISCAALPAACITSAATSATGSRCASASRTRRHGRPGDAMSEAFVFGPFRLSTARRELMAYGVPVTLGQRAFDILLALVTRQGQLVTKDELMAEVWPGVVVEENNIQVHVSALRRVLGTAGDAARAAGGAAGAVLGGGGAGGLRVGRAGGAGGGAARGVPPARAGARDPPLPVRPP